MMKQHKQFRGSVLVFALLVLSIFLSIALSTAGIVISDKNSSRATEKSTLAFQIADGAAENVLKRVYKNTDATLNDLTQNLYSNLEQGTQGRPQCNVSSGTISGSLPSASSGRYEVTFFDGNGAPLACGSTTWRTDVKRIVSSGTFGGATRAIDVSIRPAPCGGVATVTDTRGTNVTYDTVEIGNQCWMQQNMRVGNTLPPSTPSADNGIIEKYCYGNNAANCSNNGNPTYPDGGLYTWDEAMQYSTTEGAQGICPTDWHIPTNAQWYELEQFTDATVVPNAADGTPNGTDAGMKLRSGGSSRFEGNLAGNWTSGSGFSNRTAQGFFWSSSENGTSAWNHELEAASVNTVKRNLDSKQQAVSVRCILD